MSNSREITYIATAPYFDAFSECTTTFVLDVGRVTFETEPADPRIHLAPNHQEFTPPHKKSRRGKFKRSGK